jgi:flagellar hook-associated protein FlgK
MSSTALSIGVSGLNTSQRVIDLIGQNLANVNNPNYHRQVADLANSVAAPNVSTGVQVLSVRQMSDSLLDAAVTQNTSDGQFIGAQLTAMQQVQAHLAPQSGSLHDLMENFFNQLDQLASQPTDTAQRGVVLQTARQLTDGFNTAVNDLGDMEKGLDDQMKQIVSQANSITPQIAQLNQQIEQATIQGQNPNDLLDQRGQLINQLAGFMNVRAVPQDNGAVNVLGGGAPLVVGDSTVALQFDVAADGSAEVRAQGTTSALQFDGGQLGGLLQVRNSDLPDYSQRLDTLAGSLVRGLDGAQATGLGLTGPSTYLAGTRPVSNPRVPLAQAGLGYPPSAGTLYVSVTNLSTNQRTLTPVNVDPTTQSLQGFTAAFNASVGNAQAVIDGQSNTLRILAQPGYAIDFAGRLPSAVQNSTLSGTATASVGGQYTGGSNGTYQFQLAGSGTVGVTQGLTLNVLDGSGKLLRTLGVGQGYQPGTNLDAGNGITVQLSAGTVNANEGFSTPVVSQPDTAGILTALGVNTLFTGHNAGDLTVNPTLIKDPSQLSASRSGQVGDGSNLTQMAALRDQLTLSGGTQTPSDYARSLTGDIGARTQSLGDQQTASQAMAQNLQAQQQSVSGVDQNEELVHLLSFQRAFQMSSEYLSIVNQTLDELTNIIK